MESPIVWGRAGVLPICFVVDPALARQVLQGDQERFRRNPLVNRVLRSVSGRNLFTASGPAWQWRRSLIGPSLRREAIERRSSAMICAVEGAIASWPSGVAVDTQALAMQAALDVAAEMMFSTTLDPGVGQDLRSAMDDVVGWISARMERPLSAPLSVPTSANRRFRRSRRRARELVAGLIDQRLYGSSASSDLLDDLIGAVDPGTGRALSREQLVDEVLVLLFAGHETTASAAAWAIELLARHPVEQDRAAAKVVRATSGGPVAPELIPQLHLVRAVVDETLRLYPPAWGVPRMPYRTAKLGSVTVRPFTPTIVALAAMHRSPADWENPTEFRPDRFVGAARNGAHQPFGLGPRRCVGANFATQELVVLIASLLRDRALVSATDQPATPHAAFALRARGSRVVFTPRV